ncbi:sperm acrosome membrane-associated protein 4-like [Gadus morhua]|uniref:sperm acrosome membrane-associated protein 4-like n=1 Tax=Gadus morhua TaxID=8049 RepID=UPI0011B66F0A|nr:protein Bouncer-like [Gadus morhua]
MSHSQIILWLLFCLPLAGGLRCYACLFPAISPMDCLQFPQECPAGQRCLSSTAESTRGGIGIKIYEKSCTIPTQCGQSGQKHTAGYNFNYSNVCCDTDLCNSAPLVAAPAWRTAVLCLLPLLYHLLV